MKKSKNILVKMWIYMRVYPHRLIVSAMMLVSASFISYSLYQQGYDSQFQNFTFHSPFKAYKDTNRLPAAKK